MPRIFGRQVVGFTAGTAKKTTGGVVAFVHRHLVSAPDKLMSCCQAANTSAKNCYLPGHYIFPFAGKFLFASINSLWKSGGCVCLLVTFGCYCMLHGQQPGSSGRLRFGYWWAVQSNSSSTLRALISSNRSASGRPIAGFAFSQVPSATNSMRLSARSPWRHRKQRSAKRSSVMIASPV